MEGARANQIIRFGDFELDLRAGELRKSGSRVRLPEQPLQVLALLVERPGEAVMREELQQRLWSSDTFVDFDAGVNRAISRIREALGDSADQPRYVETLPKRGYRFIFPMDHPCLEATTSPHLQDIETGKVAAEVSEPKRRHSYWWAAAFLMTVVLALTGSWFLRPQEESRMPVPFAANALDGSFSPDGNQLAFAWNGEAPGNYDIYIKQIGGDTSRRLTTAPQFDYCPAWSPDGHSIAFMRVLEADRIAVMVVSSNGGRERQIAEFRDFSIFPRLGWHPGGKWLALGIGKDTTGAVPGIFLLSAETGEKRRLTLPPPGAKHDSWPAFSPDGRCLAFARFCAAQTSEIYLLSISSELSPVGEPRQLTFGNQFAGFPAWMPDGNEIIFAFGNALHYASLWRIVTSSSHKPKPLPFVAGDVIALPAVSLEKHRLIYTVLSKGNDIWRGQIHPEKEKPVPTAKFIDSTRNKEFAEYSSDGKHVVYVSWDSGSAEIWICETDGSHRTQLTHLGGPNLQFPRWSPDGRQIIFHLYLRSSGQRDLYLISAQGGPPRQLTHTPHNEGHPCFSRDGKWIFFSSDRTGEDQVWKMPVQGGDQAQVTRTGGYVPTGPWDGEFIYYLKPPGSQTISELWKVPVQGGTESRVLGPLYRDCHAIMEHGIYFLSLPTAGGVPLDYFDYATNQVKRIGLIPKIPGEGGIDNGFTVSPDERYFLYSYGASLGTDLMLVENFH